MSSSRGNSAIILAALTAGILAAIIIGPHLAASFHLTNGSSGLASANATPVAYSFAETATPVQLVIPSINVNAKIQPVGVGKSGDMAVTDSFWTVGWYEPGPVPGAAGSAVIEGHLDQVVSPYAVFFNLDELKPGDAVNVIDAQGRTVDFTVTGTKTEPYNAPTEDIFKNPPPGTQHAPGESFLNLVTCAGTWIPSQHQYDERLIVFTKRAS